MAKPGSNAARRLSARGVDLQAAGMTDEELAAARVMIETKLGMRCNGCGERITVGFRFTSVAPRDTQAPVMQLVACSREECGFAEQARDGATVVEAVEFVWLDESNPPPAE